jgi:hypothetical protein
MLDAMLALAAARGGFQACEYSFDFEGGAPPWMSGMAQGTGVQALSRAFQLTGDARYRDAATNGTHYLTYSYAPDLFIFNGFLQALVGLDDYRDVLLRDILKNLCKGIGTAVYCDTAERFTAYLAA